MRPSFATATAALSSWLRAGRPLNVIVRARSSRRTGDTTTVSVRLTDSPNRAKCGKQLAASTPRLGQFANTGAETLAKKVRVSLRFDAVLLARVSESAKRQGITRTSWLHRAAFDALGDTGVGGA
jgi:hypothetical protein